MSVYVDGARNKFGRMQMCHMIADSAEELLTMAETIGLQKKWLQGQGTYKEHFDICLSKRALAVAHGAREIGIIELGRLMLSRSEKGRELLSRHGGEEP